ncbi:MAG TPA: hypothetical protein VIQ54_33715 [Polyangia bacterium]|jgi:hypothetical protein
MITDSRIRSFQTTRKIQTIRSVSLAGVCAAFFFSGCGIADDIPPGGGAGEATPEGEATGGVELALTSVPAMIQCVSVTTTVGAQTTTRSFTVAAGASTATLNLGQLPSGNATFRGNAYIVGCTAIAGATASYVADPTTATLRPGVVTSVELVFRPNNPVTVSANFLTNVAEIGVGWFGSIARMVDGTVRFWGGDPVLGFQPIAAQPPASAGLTSVVQVGLGQNMGCALKTGGSVTCWGYINDQNSFIQPTTVNLPGAAVQLAVGLEHACAVLSFGQVLCWGNENSHGELGNGSTALASTSAPATVPLNSLAGVGRLALGPDTSCLVDSSGRATCWGDNAAGVFGNGNTTSSLAPVNAAVGLGAIVDLKVGGAHACAARADGAVFCWGSNFVGQVGDGTTTTRLSPVQVPGLSQVTQVATGRAYSCAVTQGGQLSCWGSNSSGQLGDGTGLDQHSPVPVLAGVAAIRGNASFHSCAEMQDLTVRCWGFNDSGQLGTGGFVNSSIPAPVRLQ